MSGNAAYGTFLKASDGATTPVYTTILQLSSINLSFSLENDDTTHMGSTGAAKEHIPTIIDYGSVSCEGNFVADDTTQIAEYQTKLAARGINGYQILFTDVGATTATFNASVESISLSNDVGSKAGLSLSLKISGPITWA